VALISIPDVFIIESLDPDDEGNGRLEGSSISHVLRLHGKDPKYRYVRTRDQFKRTVKEYGKSNYRYLHISAHGDREGLCTTNQEEIDYDELADLLSPHLMGKRLFLSACSMVHEDMAKAIIPKTKCYSVVGPTKDIAFTDAAVFWPAIYHLMFSTSDRRMTHAVLKENLSRVRSLFDIEIGYFSKSKKLKRGYTSDIMRKNKR
jgi:hypothetical protein